MNNATIVVLLLLLSALVLAYCLSVGQHNQDGVYAEPQMVQQTFVSAMARGSYPPVNPYEPDYPLLYHWSYHLFAAAVGQAVGKDSSFGITASMVITGLLILWGGFGLCYRQTGGRWRSLSVAALLLCASTPSWLFSLDKMQTPFYTINELVQPYAAMTRNQLIGFDNLDALAGSYSIPFGYVGFIGAVWCYLELRRQKYRNPAAWLGTVLCAALMLGSNEALVLAFFGGLVIHPLLVWLVRYRLNWAKVRPQLIQLWMPLVIGLATVVAGWPTQNVLSVLTSSGGSVKLTFTEHFGSLVGRRNNFYDLFSPEMLVHAGLLPLVLVPLVYMLKRGYKLGLGGWLGLMALPVLVFAALFYPKIVPLDILRFNQAGFTLLVVAGVLVLAALYDQADKSWLRQSVAGAAIGLSVLWIGPGLVAGAYAVTESVPPGCTNPADVAAARFINNHTSYGSRLLIVNGPTGFYPGYNGGLYACNDGAMMARVLMQYTGGPLPMGFTAYTHIEDYSSLYQRANQLFDEDAIRQLKIELLYFDPDGLNPWQRAGLQRLMDGNRLEVLATFESASSVVKPQVRRNLYRLRPVPNP